MSELQKDVDISQLTFEQLKKVRAYLGKLIDSGGSDLHIKANSIIRARVNGHIVPFSSSVYSYEEAMIFVKEILRGRFGELVEKKDIDLVYQYDDRHRFRVNIFFQTNGPSAVFRLIPMDIPTFEKMGYPEVIKTLAKEERGLLLVTGITGSGKSTTLAAIINDININARKHIITIEDPIEFVHKDKNCIINQRSIGQDVLSFDRALRAALREDPDIILVGEMRDRETVELALHAADTGHLVLSTLHTIDARETINRIVAMFPTEEQNRIRLSLATVLKGIISQRLIPTVDNKRIAAFEILVKTPTIEKLIFENRDYEIREALEKGREYYKSQSFDQHIFDLYSEGKISRDKAKEYATSASDLELKMSGLGAIKGSSSTTKTAQNGQKFNDDEFFNLKN